MLRTIDENRSMEAKSEDARVANFNVHKAMYDKDISSLDN